MRILAIGSKVRVISRVAGLAALATAVCATGASAQGTDCQGDIGKLQQKRETYIAALNRITKAGKGKLDPIAACPQLRSLSAIEGQILDYMQKNQNWCDIPDTVIENVKEGRQKTAGFAGQACKFAEQARRAQQQAAQGGGAPQAPRLPTGPL
jgi:hypothetical protein